MPLKIKLSRKANNKKKEATVNKGRKSTIVLNESSSIETKREFKKFTFTIKERITTLIKYH